MKEVLEKSKAASPSFQAHSGILTVSIATLSSENAIPHLPYSKLTESDAYYQLK